MTESHRIEYKKTLTEQLEKEVIAFLNLATGGVIYLGVNDQGKAIELENSDAIQLKIKDRLKNNIAPQLLRAVWHKNPAYNCWLVCSCLSRKLLES